MSARIEDAVREALWSIAGEDPGSGDRLIAALGLDTLDGVQVEMEIEGLLGLPDDRLEGMWEAVGDDTTVADFILLVTARCPS